MSVDVSLPVPRPAIVARPTADDFKMDATSSVAPKQIELPRVNANTDPKPAEPATTATAPAATPAPAEAPKPDTAATTPAAPAPATAAASAVEPVKVSTVPAA